MKDVQSECKTLPEELVGRIIAMLPFPSIFVARAISKSWQSRFSPVSSINNEVEKGLATLFQMQVSERSHNWETFGPVSFVEELGSAYDKRFRNGSKCLPSLRFLPETVSQRSLDLEGPLLCGYVWSDENPFRYLGSNELSSSASLFVANIVTKSWKQLPPLPNALRNDVIHWKKLVRETSLKTYKVIVLCINLFEHTSGGCSFQTYDSMSDGWISKDFDKPNNLVLGNPSAYLHGVLYVACEEDDDVLAFNLEEGTWEEIRMTSFADESITRWLVVCNASLLRIDTNHDRRRHLQEHVLKNIDLVSKQLLEVARGPAHRVKRWHSDRPRSIKPFSDGTSLFFGTTGRLMTYNVEEDHWSWFNFHHSWDINFRNEFELSAFVFQPGLNPFAEV